jgi:alpha-mannosidase
MMMQRRELLKGLTTLAGGAMLPSAPWSTFAQQAAQNSNPPLAVPIRALARINGALMQPIRISVRHTGPSGFAVTKLNGVEVDRRLVAEGVNTFQVFTSPVDRARDAAVAVTVGEDSASTVVPLQPVRRLQVYLLPHSHHDLGYTDLQPKIEERQMHNIELGIDLARKTANYPEGARFVWNLEVLWGADLYMRRKPQAAKDELIDAVKTGWVSLNGMYANELTGLCRPEELLQLFRYSRELGRQCGVAVDSAMLSDVPGYTWGTITAMAQAGIRYFSAAPNNFDRIGTLMETWQDKPFWHFSPSGKEKVLVWIPWLGYAFSHREKIMTPELVGKYQDRLDSIQFPYDISYERWSGHGDNAEPDPEIAEFVKSWGQEYEWPKFTISSVGKAFSAFEQRYGNDIPKMHGDLTPYWEDGAGSSALETRINRNAADRLTQAEAMCAMVAPTSYRASDFNEAWRNVLLYSEHTWGAAGSVADPESPMTKGQWEFKRQFALDAEAQSKNLLAAALNSSAAGADPSAIDVCNTTSWSRTEVIYLAKELSASGDRVSDSHGNPLPSQRLSTGELAFLARAVPPFGSARFHISAGEPHAPPMPVSVKDGVLDNGILRARIDPSSGDLVELRLHGAPGNLIDTLAGETANQYLYIKGKDFAAIRANQKPGNFDGPDVGSIEKSGVASISVEEAGPLVASLRIESLAPGCNSLVRRMRLRSGADWLELSNVVDKERAPAYPDPDDRKALGAWTQYGGKESVQFAFPLAVPNGAMHVDIPMAEMRPELDQLPGSCKNWLPVGRWIDVSNTRLGVTWVTLDAPLVEIGEISATLVGSNHNPQVWREHIAPTQKFYSWVMNNHWETNYRAYQEGVVEFRYALRAHRDAYDPAAASRFAIGLSQPLLARGANSDLPMASRLRIEPVDVLALALKPSDDTDGLMIRLFGASGENRRARLVWPADEPRRLSLSDTSESRFHPLPDEIPVAGWDVVTVRAERID